MKKLSAAIWTTAVVLVCIVRLSTAEPTYNNPYNGTVTQNFELSTQIDAWWDFYGCTWWPYGDACAWVQPVAVQLFRELRADCFSWSSKACESIDPNGIDVGACSGNYYAWHNVSGVLHLFSCQRCGAIREIPTLPPYYTVRVDPEICTFLY